VRNAIVGMPGSRSASDERQVLRAAIRQLDRAEIYLDAVRAMDLADTQAVRAVNQVRADVNALRHYLVDLRARP